MITLLVLLLTTAVFLALASAIVVPMYRGIKQLEVSDAIKGLFAVFAIAYYHVTKQPERADGTSWRNFLLFGIVPATLFLFIIWGGHRLLVIFLGAILIGLLYLPLAWEDRSAAVVLRVLAFAIILSICGLLSMIIWALPA